ncbi:hypothetical protein [Macrococcus brunensis]|uniref:hypothetical protein n=1 Tax=Macrococcus brunensis TaxID=198483 RepID=UPI001EEF8664|nr:hypothetical protein [Macrococcus brunensis]ULG74225.1 hypothetical protein MGG13_00175 [Macrococcus brunensis]
MKKILITIISIFLLVGLGFILYFQYSQSQELSIEKEKLKLKKAEIESVKDKKENSEKESKKSSKKKDDDLSKTDSQSTDEEIITTETPSTNQSEQVSNESNYQSSIESDADTTQTQDDTVEQATSSLPLGDAPTQDDLIAEHPSADRTECIPSVLSETGCVYVTPEEYDRKMAEMEQNNVETQVETQTSEDIQ